MPLIYDKQLEAYICAIHGDVGDNVGWVQCYAGCDDGYFDDYEDDPLESDLHVVSVCSECDGHGGWKVCGVCNKDNPDVEW